MPYALFSIPAADIVFLSLMYPLFYSGVMNTPYIESIQLNPGCKLGIKVLRKLGTQLEDIVK